MTTLENSCGEQSLNIQDVKTYPSLFLLSIQLMLFVLYLRALATLCCALNLPNMLCTVLCMATLASALVASETQCATFPLLQWLMVVATKLAWSPPSGSRCSQRTDNQSLLTQITSKQLELASPVLNPLDKLVWRRYLLEFTSKMRKGRRFWSLNLTAFLSLIFSDYCKNWI